MEASEPIAETVRKLIYRESDPLGADISIGPEPYAVGCAILLRAQG